jgi:hypothetical protein
MDRLDPQGYIRPEADLANVQPEYQGLPEAAAGLLADAFGPRLHSAYLYGSVVPGNAVPGRSDVDALAVLLTAPTDEDRARADGVERALVERFPVLFSAGVGLTHLQEIRSPAQRYGLQVFLRELAVCIWGEDLRPGLPRTRPSAAVAAGFHDDAHVVLARARQTLATSTDPEVMRRVGGMASKKMGAGGVRGRDGARVCGRRCWRSRRPRSVLRSPGGRRPRGAPPSRGGGPWPMPVSSGAAGHVRPLGRGRARPGGVGGEQPRSSGAVTRGRTSCRASCRR